MDLESIDMSVKMGLKWLEMNEIVFVIQKNVLLYNFSWKIPIFCNLPPKGKSQKKISDFI